MLSVLKSPTETPAHGLSPPRPAFFLGHEFHLAVVVIKAREFQRFWSKTRGPGDGDLNLARLFELRDFLAFLIEQVVGDLLGDADLDALNIFAVGGQLQHPHHVDAHAFASLDLTGAFAMRTIVVNAALQRRPNTLPRHLDNAEWPNFENLGSGPIALDGFAHGSLDAAAVLFVAHVDEVVDDDTAQIAQAQLPGDFLG